MTADDRARLLVTLTAPAPTLAPGTLLRIGGGREDRRSKAARYLVSGRLVVALVTADEIRASCRGDSGSVWELGCTGASWWCSCPARGVCSHLTALKWVTLVNR